MCLTHDGLAIDMLGDLGEIIPAPDADDADKVVFGDHDLSSVIGPVLKNLGAGLRRVRIMNGKYVGMDDPGRDDGFLIGFLYGGLDRRLLYKPPLGQTARSRLAVLRDTNDGFLVAQRDLELRGPGELLGTRQTGLPDYRIANLVRDADLMPQVQLAAETIRRSAPEIGNAIVRRWLGDAGRYGKV